MLINAKTYVVARLVLIFPVGCIMRPLGHHPSRNDATRLLAQPHQIDHIARLRLLGMAAPVHLLT
ncbi:hypothetical protein D3C84_1320040 [compost metagenome]